jgi:hypothetical protein
MVRSLRMMRPTVLASSLASVFLFFGVRCARAQQTDTIEPAPPPNCEAPARL